ncbi:MAG: TRAP transporter small permease [Bacteroidetes bacterium]|nr:MAG: TRAP transporter small permease [Bacteroidota bacterium]
MLRLKAAVDRVLAGFLVVLMAVMTLNVLWQVFTRFILGDPSAFTDELSRYLLIWLGVLGAGYGVGQRIHLAIDLFPRKQTGARRIYTDLFIESIVLLFAVAVMIVGGTQLVYVTLALEQTSAALQVPLGYVYIVLPVSGLLIVFYNVAHMVEMRRRLVTGTEADGDGEDEPLSPGLTID